MFATVSAYVASVAHSVGDFNTDFKRCSTTMKHHELNSDLRSLSPSLNSKGSCTKVCPWRLSSHSHGTAFKTLNNHPDLLLFDV